MRLILQNAVIIPVLLAALAAASLGAAPSSTAARATAKLKSVAIAGVPHVQQKPDFCGEACAAMWAAHLGRPDINQDYVFNVSGLSAELGRGCYTRDLMAALERIGFKCGDGAATVSAGAAADIDAQFAALHGDLRAGVPSIICMHYDDTANASEHFRLILGYDAAADEVIYHEPAAAGGAYLRMKRPMLLKLWPLKYSSEKWTLIRLPLKGKPTPAPPPHTLGPTPRHFTAADYAQHIMKLKKKLPSDKFTIVLQPPFVVIGDEDAATLRRRSVSTVKWAVDKLKAEYFSRDPTQILDIWLFKDEDSYYKNATALFGSKPSTPFGYFSDADGALVMNIATGGGTLVHEIVHPFMAANFADCPAWFNEGLGSLYEQSGEQDGRICGYTNWRLPHLQKAIAAKRLPTFEKLTAMDSRTFYGGDNYGQSRYLCYYLQQKGLLKKYYQEFTANAAKDPTGYQTLKTVLGNPDMAVFQKQWEKWVLTLRFP
ncbi:MAG: papain-like cysteine protease family protein [Planctomycetaceae bacterium]|nr:C39 family peptidase [Planctomycetaceae bacterium]